MRHFQYADFGRIKTCFLDEIKKRSSKKQEGKPPMMQIAHLSNTLYPIWMIQMAQINRLKLTRNGWLKSIQENFHSEIPIESYFTEWSSFLSQINGPDFELKIFGMRNRNYSPHNGLMIAQRLIILDSRTLIIDAITPFTTSTSVMISNSHRWWYRNI